jgi:hypothetical protein
MHQNTFLSTPEGQKNHFKINVFGGLEMCANACKHILNTPDVQKYLFLKNTFLTTSYSKKYYFLKKSFQTPDVQKYLF